MPIRFRGFLPEMPHSRPGPRRLKQPVNRNLPLADRGSCRLILPPTSCGPSRTEVHRRCIATLPAWGIIAGHSLDDPARRKNTFLEYSAVGLRADFAEVGESPRLDRHVARLGVVVGGFGTEAEAIQPAPAALSEDETLCC